MGIWSQTHVLELSRFMLAPAPGILRPPEPAPAPVGTSSKLNKNVLHYKLFKFTSYFFGADPKSSWAPTLAKKARLRLRNTAYM